MSGQVNQLPVSHRLLIGRFGDGKDEKKTVCYKELVYKPTGEVLAKYGEYMPESFAVELCKSQGVETSNHFVYLPYNIDKALAIAKSMIKDGKIKPREGECEYNAIKVTGDGYFQNNREIHVLTDSFGVIIKVKNEDVDYEGF